MVSRKKKNFFLTLPKKELQTQCRKYGMPSYKPKPFLAEALAALLPENIDLKALNRKSAVTSCSQTVKHDDGCLDLNALPRISGKKYLGFAGIGKAEYVPWTSKIPAENALVESVRSVVVSSPSFEFHVRSEGGINLYVDLNSTPSDWAECLKKNVCITESSICTKSQGFHVDFGRFGESSSHLKGSSPVTVKEINFEHSLSGTAPHSENKENRKDFDCLDRIDGSLMSSVEVSRTTDVGFSKQIEENMVFMLPKSSSCALNQKPVSATTDEPKIDHVGDSVSNSISDGAISLITTEQPLKVITEESGNSPVRYNGDPSYLGSTVHGCSIFASVEKHLPEAAGFPNDKASPCETNGSGFVDHNCNMESEHGESANSSEVDHGTERNQLLICSEKEERSSTASGMEISEFSQFEKSYGGNSLMTDDIESSGNCPKRQGTDGVGGYCFSSPEARNLRRSNNLAGEVLPRRSMRELMSCAQTT